MRDPSLSVRLLHDDAGVWPRALTILEGQVRVVPDETHATGILTWQRATRAEVAEQPRSVSTITAPWW